MMSLWRVGGRSAEGTQDLSSGKIVVSGEIQGSSDQSALDCGNKINEHNYRHLRTSHALKG